MVEDVKSHAVVRYKCGERDHRPWGRWEVLSVGVNYVVKQISVNPNARLSLQRHRHRSESWTITAGQGLVTRDSEEIAVAVGDVVSLPRGCVHRMSNVGQGELCFVEVQLGDVLDESDIERLEDDYSRVDRAMELSDS